MPHENVALARQTLEDFLAGKSEFDTEGNLTKLAGEEHWDPHIEFDVSETVVPELKGVFRGKNAIQQ